MSNILQLTSPIPPSVNHYLATRAYINKGKPVCTVYETKEAKDYKQNFRKHIINQITQQGYDVPPVKTQHYYCDCIFYFNRIDMDCNNYFKLLLDAITETGLVWVDDNVVCERVKRIYYDYENPRIEITIRPVDYVGIFDTKTERDIFWEKCLTCKRGCDLKNCSIQKKAFKGEIQPEVYIGDNLEYCCTKYVQIKK